MDEENNLGKFKKEYSKLQKKFGLPSFQIMNEDFQIETIAKNEAEILIREIRKIIADKLAGFMKIIESLLNPSNVPLFVFSMAKSVGEKDRKNISEIYKQLAEKEIDCLELDIVFNEKKEAKFVNDSYLLWQEIKKESIPIIDSIRKNMKIKPEPKPSNAREYFR